MAVLRLALAQIDVTVGDVTGNAARIRRAVAQAEGAGANLVVFPELALAGYPPEDLLFKPHFVQANARALADLRDAAEQAAVLVGFPDRNGAGVANAAALLCGGDHVATYHKMELPNYGVFDEVRYFRPGTAPLVFDLNDVRVGVTICEDIWRADDVIPRRLRDLGAQLIVNLSASPYHAGKMHERLAVLRRFAAAAGATLAYCNLVGGQDELVFDGGSVIISPTGQVLTQGARFAEDLLLADLQLAPVRGESAAVWLESPVGQRPPLPEHRPLTLTDEEEIYAALVLGTRDYVRKNGFQRVVLGLSGGVDSTLTACIAVDAVGRENVTCISMPSRYSSAGTKSDAELVAHTLGVQFLVVPIEAPFRACADLLQPFMGDAPPGIEMENLQARIRGNMLMAFSNRFGWLVLTTGNKSENAAGYCTLYGDMAGGFAVIKDVPKMLVYRLCDYVNRRADRELVPQSVIDRAPTAELRPNQTDQDSLPPYPVLDRVIEAYVEHDKSRDEIVAMGIDKQVVMDVIRLVDRSEYKRRQSPPGVKITPRAFGRDRRMPMTNRFLQDRHDA